MQSRLTTDNNMDVLIVEDEGSHRKTLGRLLLTLEMNLSFLDNGKDALLLLQTKEYALVILDWVMPGLEGVEVCARLKRSRPLTKVIMLTAKNSLKDKLKCLNAGADAFITKPYNPDELLRTIKDITKDLKRDDGWINVHDGLDPEQGHLHPAEYHRPDVFEKSIVCGMLHNIRTPLGVAFNRSQMIDLEIGKITDSIGANDVQLVKHFDCFKTHNKKIQTAVNETMDVLEGILDMKRPDVKKRSPINLNRLIEKEIDFLSPQICIKFNVTVTLDLDPIFPLIHGAATDFSQIFRNIIQNACEAMGGSEIRQLQIETKRFKDRVMVRFADSGPGVAPSFIPEMFREHSTTKEKSLNQGSGYGLGLYVSRRMLDTYDAKIGVEKSDSSGTTLYISIPIEKNCGNPVNYIKKQRRRTDEE